MASCLGKYPTFHVITPSQTMYATRQSSLLPIVGEITVSFRTWTLLPGTSWDPHTSWAWHVLPFSSVSVPTMSTFVPINRSARSTRSTYGHGITASRALEIGGSSDNIMLLGAHHISRLGSGQWQQEYSPTESRIGKDSLQGSTSRGARAPFLGWWWHSTHTPMQPGGAAMALWCYLGWFCACVCKEKKN